ncbi:MAG: hypothetical protein AAFP90_13250 [Planctomycetota bacterium]
MALVFAVLGYLVYSAMNESYKARDRMMARNTLIMIGQSVFEHMSNVDRLPNARVIDPSSGETQSTLLTMIRLDGLSRNYSECKDPSSSSHACPAEFRSIYTQSDDPSMTSVVFVSDPDGLFGDRTENTYADMRGRAADTIMAIDPGGAGYPWYESTVLTVDEAWQRIQDSPLEEIPCVMMDGAAMTLDRDISYPDFAAKFHGS